MTQNIEQRTEVAVTKYEKASDILDHLASTDSVVETPVGKRDSFPKLSREISEAAALQHNDIQSRADSQHNDIQSRADLQHTANQNAHDNQMSEMETDFQNRFHGDNQFLEWQAGIEINDQLQVYTIGTIGQPGYKEYLANPELLPFTTSATIADDLVLNRWSNVSNADKKYATDEDRKTTEKTLNRKVIDYIDGGTFGPYAQDGQIMQPRLEYGGAQYVTDDLNETITFTGIPVNNGDGTITIDTAAHGNHVFSSVGARALTKKDLSLHINNTLDLNSYCNPKVGGVISEAVNSFEINGITYPLTKFVSGNITDLDLSTKSAIVGGVHVRLLKVKYYDDDEKTDIRLFFVKKNNVLSSDLYSDIIEYVSSTTENLYSPISYQVSGGPVQDIPSNFTFSGSGAVTFDNFAFGTPMMKGEVTTISTIVGSYSGGYWIDVVNGAIFSDGDYILFENNKLKWNLNPQPTVTVDYKSLTLPEALESYLTEVRQIDRVDGNRVYFKQAFTERYDPATSTLTKVDVREDITFDGVDFKFINLKYPNMHFTGAQRSQFLNRPKFNAGMMFENCNDGYYENINIDSEDSSLSFHGSRRNSIITPKLSHKMGDAAILFYQGSMDNEVIGGSASLKSDSFASGVLIYDISNRCTVDGFNAKGFHRCVDIRGYSRGAVVNNNTLTINYLRKDSRNFSICINAEFTAELTAKNNKCISAVIPNAAYNMIGLYCVGVSDSEISNNDFTNCSIFCGPPFKFYGYENFVTHGNENSIVGFNTLRSRMTIPSSFQQNIIDYGAVIAPATRTDINVAPAFITRYGIINNSPLSGWRMPGNNVDGFPAAKVDINANTDFFNAILRGGEIKNCGCGILVLGMGEPKDVTVPVYILGHDFEKTFNAIVNLYYPGMVVDYNNFSNCHNIINYASGTADNAAWRGHAFSGTAMGMNNTYKKYYNIYHNQGTFNIENENVAKLPDGVTIRDGNKVNEAVSKEYIRAGNNESSPATLAKITRTLQES
ncbi:hypothetical protein [Vibrio splendidus]|uniref:hypothetical protein n=1 Tax=Vibrio splendidus TaxID=29497 RepID=UPI003D0A0B8B